MRYTRDVRVEADAVLWAAEPARVSMPPAATTRVADEEFTGPVVEVAPAAEKGLTRRVTPETACAFG